MKNLILIQEQKNKFQKVFFRPCLTIDLKIKNEDFEFFLGLHD